MCGIAGVMHLRREPIPGLSRQLEVMNELQRHRGPDGEAIWCHDRRQIGLAHLRLSIIDLIGGAQPMHDPLGNVLVYNGEIYNYIELRDELGADQFATASDSEVILHAYRAFGPDCVTRFRGMFAFALWDEASQTLFCARDHFGIKPLYYTVSDGTLYFASEVKALLPFVDRIETDLEGFKDYLAFQFCLAGKTLFKGIHELQPGHWLRVTDGRVEVRRYWDVYYTLDFDHTARYFEERLAALLEDSVRLHMRADVPVGAYVSGGIDSSLVASLARRHTSDFLAFTGKFSLGPEYDESGYARLLAEQQGFALHEVDITADDFMEHIRKVIYHLDYPVAGPGSFPQYVVSQLAARHRKVVLGGQGGDEIFGGYARYLIAYFEQCIKAAIDGTMHNGNFIVTYESIIPNLATLRNYKPMLQEFWRDGLFEEMDRRYFRLINRAPTLQSEINWELLGDYSPFETFKTIFHGRNVGPTSYFDLMTHFDFKTLLPALLHVEDRVSMAHGLESRVPLLDVSLVEFAATIPANVKFKDGTMKRVLKHVARASVPQEIVDRQDKMGFPTPLVEWANGPAQGFIRDIFSSQKARERDLINNRFVVDGRRTSDGVARETKFGRKLWGLLCLEIWQQEFHDQEWKYKKMVAEAVAS
jgi:asparagine synthase (glutamine-hydrolysing)